ncbi:MAG: DegQ family serine endoprotease [Verrucomicrobia bacterium]|nr:DegQ family serine endoprotease [Verrucomicrobiota bacterium]
MKQYLSQTSGKLTLMLGLLAVAGWLTVAVVAKESAAPPKVTVSDKPIDRTGGVGVSYSPVVKKVAPSVVNIYSTRTVRVPRFWSPFMEDPMLRRFFGGEDADPRGSRPQTRQQQGLGSGVIVTEDGYILTNNHVIEGADKDGVKVALGDDKTEFTARIVGTDPQTDVAVLKIEASNLKPITLGDSDQLEVGDIVLAVGNPFGVGQSVTMGIVSALGRGFGILGRQGYEDFIQTDAPINPGNSGGALVDVEGRLVGISQSIVSGSGANAGVGFAVPINFARAVMDQLVTDGRVSRGYLGVNIQTLTPELAKEFKLPDENGALVGGVQPGTPAAAAGLKEGDVITEFNGRKVSDSSQFRVMVAQMRPKSKVTLKLIRDGKDRTVTATLGTLPDELGGLPGGEPERSTETPSGALDGVQLGDLDSRLRRQYDLPRELEGALVTNVEAGSAAENVLRAGDVIVEVNRRAVRNADDAVELAENARGDRILLRVWSNAGGLTGTRYVTLQNRTRE